MKLKKEYIKLTTKSRLYNQERPLIAITGGIGTGKSSVTNYLKSKYKLQIIDADKLVHEIYENPKTKDFVKANAPDAITKGVLDFPKLRELVFKDDALKDKVEAFIYAELPEAFDNKAKEVDQDFLIYDVPLLFEKNLASLFDSNILVYSPRNIQISRVKKRDHSSEEVIMNILNKQLDIEEKKKQADLIIDNSKNRNLDEMSWPEVDQLIDKLFD